MMTRVNTVLEDVAAVIGFAATLRLSAWYGGASSMYVPLQFKENMPLAHLIGASAAQRLIAQFGGQSFCVPRICSYEEDCRKRRVANLAMHGFSVRAIANTERMSKRRVQQIIQDLIQIGMMIPASPKNTDYGLRPDFDLRLHGQPVPFAPQRKAKHAGKRKSEAVQLTLF